jgi:hypothetical protein
MLPLLVRATDEFVTLLWRPVAHCPDEFSAQPVEPRGVEVWPAAVHESP